MDKLTELDRTLNRVMDMLKYAETKNAILLTFEAGLLYAIMTTYSSQISNNPWLLLFGLSVYTSMLLLLISFIPNLLKTNNSKNEKNIQFYGDIASMNVEEFKNLYDTKFVDLDEFYEDLQCQIHYNSKIANKKFKYFRYAINVLFVLPLLVRFLFLVSHQISKRINEV